MSVSYTHPLCSGTAQPEQKCLREGGSSDPGVNANASSKLEADLMDQLSFFESKGFFYNTSRQCRCDALHKSTITCAVPRET